MGNQGEKIGPKNHFKITRKMKKFSLYDYSPIDFDKGLIRQKKVKNIFALFHHLQFYVIFK